ncbi:putative reverse transcriptase domain-containing protein [Tanacetum coccineum]|uniref:Reverse transcriptase domain-containing protein n=1 Tax=Tanacetum coccineum TaxID=301880 RepID=A0ABQ4ZBJ5_9ASTR
MIKHSNTKNRELRVADRRRQKHLTEALTLMRTLQTQSAAQSECQAAVTGHSKPLSFASMVKEKMMRKIVKHTKLTNEETVQGAHVAIPLGAIDEVSTRFENTLYGYFIGKRLAFLIVENYVKNAWEKYGIEWVMLQNGCFFFQFATKEGMERVLENGPWLIRLVPIILNIWTPNARLKKDEITMVPIWVKLHNVPIEVNKARDLVMSDLEDSTVTYTEAPTSPDYVLGPEEPEQAPPSPEFVPEPVSSEFMPSKDEVFLAEEQPLPVIISPTADSPRYIADFDPEEDEEDPEEDLADYPTDGGDDDDDDDESSDDEEDDDDYVEEDEDEEEEEHLAPADSVPPPVHRVARLLAIPTPPPSPLSLLSSPLPQILSPLPQILSPPLPVSPPLLPASPTYHLGYRAAMIQLRAETPSTFHPLPSSTPPSGTPPLLPIPLPTLSPPLLLPSTNCRAGVSKVTLPSRKRLCIALGLRFKIGESSSAPTARPTRGFRADYGFVGTLDDEIRQDTYEIYGRLDDAQDDRLLMSGQLNMLRRDRRAHARTARLMETKARLSREAWTQVTTLQSQQGPASGPAQPEILEEASSSL